MSNSKKTPLQQQSQPVTSKTVPEPVTSKTVPQVVSSKTVPQVVSSKPVTQPVTSKTVSQPVTSKPVPLQQQSQGITYKKVYGGCMDCNEYPDRKTCTEKTGVPLCYINKQSCIAACKSKKAFKKAKEARHLLHEATRSARLASYEARKSKREIK